MKKVLHQEGAATTTVSWKEGEKKDFSGSKVPMHMCQKKIKIMRGRREEPQSQEVIGMNDFANASVRFISDLIANGCFLFENRMFYANVTLGDY